MQHICVPTQQFNAKLQLRTPSSRLSQLRLLRRLLIREPRTHHTLSFDCATKLSTLSNDLVPQPVLHRHLSRSELAKRRLFPKANLSSCNEDSTVCQPCVSLSCYIESPSASFDQQPPQNTHAVSPYTGRTPPPSLPVRNLCMRTGPPPQSMSRYW